MRAVEAGYDVVGFDVDEREVEASHRRRLVRRGHPDDDRARRRSTTGRYRAVTSLDEVDGFDIAVITVPTPLREGVPDLDLHRGRGARRWRAHLRPGATVILESTTYPGTTEELVAPILEDGSGLVGRRRLPPRLQPRAHRSRQPDVDAS